MKNNYVETYHLGSDFVLSLIKGKWKTRIICHLGNEPFRHDELLHAIDGISQKVLSEQLNALIKEGIVVKKDNGTFPRVVTYSLTSTGMELRNILRELSIWGEKRAAEFNDEHPEQQVKIEYKYLR